LSGCSTKTLDLNQAEAELGSMLLMLTKQPPGKTHGRLDDDEEEPFGVSESELKRTMAFMGLDDSSRENLHAQAWATGILSVFDFASYVSGHLGTVPLLQVHFCLALFIGF
jgi:hypothetical protein